MKGFESMIEFDRDIYKKISEWKNGYNKNKVLFEVKSRKNPGGTITTALQDGKIDRALYCKGNTYGGIDGKKITIPIYLFPKFKKEVFY